MLLYELLLLLLGVLTRTSHAYTPVPRWGQAQTLVNDILLVHGGKTNPSNDESYTAAPTNNDVLSLSFSSSFDVSSPPWNYVSGSTNTSTDQGPMLAWHTISAFNDTHMLVFGGDGGPNSPIVLPSQADSAMLLDVQDMFYPTWDDELQSWAGEPIRRIHHSTSSAGGKVYLIGGEKDDGSNNAFSEHYVFDPSVPSFMLLPTSNSPPDIYGHTSVVLSNGTMLVFGGYSQTAGTLLPFSSVWAMDSTSSSPSWSILSVSSTELPSPRRAFAATVVNGTQVIIHGGSDALLQESYSDGWVLDTTQNPMTWSNISSLSDIGARRDHFAIAIGTDVAIGFGYGTNGGASASLMVYDTVNQAFLTSFAPLSTGPASTLGPTSTGASGSSPTGGRGGGGSGSGPGSGTGSGSGSNSGSGSGSSSGDGSSLDTADKAGIAVGVLALVAAAITAGYHVYRRQHGQRFHRLDGTDEADRSFGGLLGFVGSRPPREKVRMSGADRTGWRNSLPIGRTNIRRERLNMFEDEDIGQYDVDTFQMHNHPPRQGSGSSTWSSVYGAKALTDVVQGSIRSVGAAFGSWGPWGREGLAQGFSERAVVANDPFSDEEALLATEGGGDLGASRLRGGQSPRASTHQYKDPFADQERVSIYTGDTDHVSSSFDGLPSGSRSNPPYSEEGGISGLRDSPFTGLSSQTGSTSQTSHESPPTTPNSSSSKPQYTSIIGNSTDPQPIRRSGSWWNRFATPLLERRSSDIRRPILEPLDFRDPNPAPKLNTIREASGQTSSAESPESGLQAPYSTTAHQKSLSSVRTADSGLLEGLGGNIDVALRGGSLGSNHTAAGSSGGDSVDSAATIPWLDQRHLSDIPSLGAAEGEEGAAILVTSPTETRSQSQDDSDPLRTPVSNTNKRLSMGGAVASRVQAYERRMSQDSSDALMSPTSPTGVKNTRKREERHGKPVNVKYGIVPRAPLFVANPDRERSGSSDT